MNNKTNTFNYNVSTTHPVMPTPHDTAQYEEVHHYISVHSEDRNVLKYPDSSSFEIELPRDYYNVKILNVSEMALPINIDTFNLQFNNVFLTFQIIEPYDPYKNNLNDPLQQVIYTALTQHIGQDFLFRIEDGFYSVDQIATELTNKFNFAVSQYLEEYIRINAPFVLPLFLENEYTDFVIVYNYVGQYLWFGNRSSGFVITNDSPFYAEQELNFNSFCINEYRFPQYVNWGLPNNLGFTRLSEKSIMSPNQGKDVRFYYGDVVSGDNGFWLTPNPDLPGCNVYYVKPPGKINILGEAYIYMLVDGWNNIDVTYPYNNDEFTRNTNETNGACQYAFGKIPVASTPVALSYCGGFFNPRVMDPPINKIRRVRFAFYYHSGIRVSFNNMPFSITFDLTCLKLKKK